MPVRNINQLYNNNKDDDDEIVKVRDYINSYGSRYGITDDMIGWKGDGTGGGNVLLGGQNIMNVGKDNIQDQRSYGSKLDLRSAIDSYAKENNLSNIRTGYENPYADDIDNLLQELLNYEKFTYNPENDPSFQSYKNQYTRAGNRAMEDTMGAAAGMTGGRTNSWSETVASQAKQNWDDALMDRIPELEQAAYGRYLNDRNMGVQNLQQLMALDQTGYNRFADQRNFDRGMFESDRNFDFSQDQFNWQQETDQRNFDRNVLESDRAFDYQVERDKVLDDKWLKQFNADEQQRIISNALQNRQISLSEANYLLNKNKYENSLKNDEVNTWLSYAAQQLESGKSEEDVKKHIGTMYRSGQIDEDTFNEVINKFPSVGEGGGELENTVSLAYQDMMSSDDPQQWLIENAPYMTNDELKALYGYLPKDNETARVLAEILNR